MNDKRPTVGIISLGCAKNRVDTENLLGMLTSRGFIITNEPKEAEVIIVNTCGFITPAKEESIGAILDMAQYRTDSRFPCSLLAVTGCLSQRYEDELLKELPEVDIMWGVKDYERFLDLLCQRFGLNMPSNPCKVNRILTTPSYSAYLRISDGCFNHCSYCAIPLIRGNMKSVPEEELVYEAQRLADSGVSELNVIAQDTSAYGLDLYRELRLPKLLDRLARISEFRIIRLLYAYPDTLTQELMDVILAHDNIANYIDLPIQHINNRILKAMNRRTTGEEIRRIIAKLRNLASDFVIRTSLIVGFPGETDEMFEELLDFLEEYPINRVGAFMYSPEEGTPAAAFPDQIDESVKRERFDTLMQRQSAISLRLNKNRIDSIVNVLIDGNDAGVYFGRSYAQAPDVDGVILIKTDDSKRLKAGEYRRVRLINALEYDMEGELYEHA